MNATGLMFGLAGLGLFPSRAFMPAFCTGLLLRYGPMIPVINRLGLMAELQDESTWLSHPMVLMVLGLLSLLEIAATKLPELQEWLDLAMQWIKPILASAVTLGVFQASETAAVGLMLDGGSEVMVVAGSAGVGVWLLTWLRNGVWYFIAELDDGDELGLYSLCAWCEDFWVLTAILLLFVIPVLILVLVGLVLALLAAVRWWVARADKKMRRPCAGCGEMIYAHALHCHTCQLEVTEPMAVGFFGQPLSRLVVDKSDHQLSLLERGRCPNCAVRLTGKKPVMVCGQCHQPVMTDMDLFKAYLRRIDRRMPWILVASLVCSAVPIVGAVIGILIYRLEVVLAYKRHLPTGSRLLQRLLLVIAGLILLAIQWVPLLGAGVVPLMALMNYAVYRRALCRLQSAGVEGLS